MFETILGAGGVVLAQAEVAAQGGIIERVVESLKNAFLDMAAGATELIPKLVVGLVILLIGYILAKVIQKTILGLGKKIGLDSFADKTGLHKLFVTAGVKATFTVALAKLIFIGLMIYFLKASAEATSIRWLTEPLQGIVNFLPKAITAAIIVTVGYMAAELVRNVVSKSCERLGLDYGRSLATLLFGFILMLILTIAVGELGVNTMLISATVIVALLALGLSVGIALGLGLVPLARNVVSGVYARELYQPGSEVEVDGQGGGSVVCVGPVMTKVERSDGGYLMVPNSQLVTESTKGKESREA